MSDAALLDLARAAGLAPRWRDTFGAYHDVAPDTLRRVLAALDLPADTEAAIADSRARLAGQAGGELPPLVTADAGEHLHLPCKPGRFEVVMEDGHRFDGEAWESENGCTTHGIDQPGYHRLSIGGRQTTIAVAPRDCFGIHEAAPGRRAWGLSVQLYALRRAGDAGLGDFLALRGFVAAAARHGAAAVAISPVHAQFSADLDRFSPYSPSSRLALNVLHADTDGAGLHEPDAARLEVSELIDWPAASRLRLERLRRSYRAAMRNEHERAALAAFRAANPGLEDHARFEALHAHFFGTDAAMWNWRSWPAGLQQPHGPEVAQFAREHADEVGFHAFLQLAADRSLAAAQQAARDAGMPIGLIADLAVGADGGGSQAWSRQSEMLPDMSVGAPPDLLSRDGQDWGISAFSPTGLRKHGYGAFLEMLRAALRHAGGVRIDHAMGLARLWLVPSGALSRDGVYLHFPHADLLRLIALESRRHRALVLGEDLGTLPEGFQEMLRDRGILGMRVLWFEQDEQGRYTPPASWSPGAAAMTSTHDLATVAGWWSGRDLDWRSRLHLLRDETADRAAREHERPELWQAMRDSGAADGDAPPPDAPETVVDAAIRHVGGSACQLALFPVEDILGLTEQPNLPGTMDTHPNWRRRLPEASDRLLEAPAAARRLAGLSR
jgi:4-alpha-glucanotransferase